MWVIIWFWRWWLCVNFLLQKLQLYRFSPVWIAIWRRRPAIWNVTTTYREYNAPDMCRAAPRCAFSRGFATDVSRWTTLCKCYICTVCNQNVYAGADSDHNAEIHQLHFALIFSINFIKHKSGDFEIQPLKKKTCKTINVNDILTAINLFVHKLQENGLSPLWIKLCLKSTRKLVKKCQ